MWTWVQSKGHLLRDGQLVSTGYSGRGRGLNNPAMQAVRATGPVPQGRWRIGAPYDSKRVGAFTLPLYALDGKVDDVHAPTGRSAFRIHGDNRRGDRSASHGCIILPRAIRTKIWTSGDRELTVVA